MHKYSVQFRVFGRNLDPDAVTRELGLEPNLIRRPGDKRGRERTWDESMWSYDGTDGVSDQQAEWDSLEEGISFLLARLSSKSEIIQRYARIHQMIWWCGHFQSSFDGGPTLSPELLRRMSDFGVGIYIDNYFASEE